jgi:CheY-like chemotaxis protein
MSGPCHFLAVENDPNEAFFLGRAFEKIAELASVHVCRNVAETREYLEGAGNYSDRAAYPLPDAILSDLNMPLENGLDLLAWLKEQPGLSKIPVIIFSGASSHAEIEKVKRMGASEYIEKPSDYHSLVETIERIARAHCESEPS